MENILFKNKNFVWHNLENPTNKESSAYLNKFALSDYTISDALEPGHLPKLEHHDHFDFMLIRFYGKEKRVYTNIVREYSHKIGIFIGNDFLLTVHQKKVPFFQEILNHLNQNNHKENITSKDLFYKIVKRTLDSYMAPSIRISEQIDLYENSLFTQSKEIDLSKLYQLKRESATCSKILVLTRDVLNEYRAYVKSVSVYKDLLELNGKIIHLHNQNSDDLQNLFHLSLSLSSQRTNDIMKLLTIFSIFFLPITFITGLYGMNFKFMPELDYRWSYFIVLAIMLLLVLLIYIWFRRKKIL